MTGRADAAATDLFMVFRIQRRSFAVPAELVREALWMPRLEPLEAAPQWVLGTFDLRGSLVTVVSTDIYFGHAPPVAQVEDQVLVIERPDGLMGLHISEALAVASPQRLLSLPEEEVATAPAIGREAEIDGRLFPVIEPARIPWHREESSPGLPDAEERLNAFEADLDEAGRRVLDERNRLLREDVAAAEPAATASFVLMELEGETFALPAVTAVEFAAIGQLTPAPATPAHIRGFTSLRGEVITLVDIRHALGVPGSALWEPGVMVVFSFDGRLTGIAADVIHDVVLAHEEPAGELPVAVQSEAGDWTTSCIRLGEHTIPVLDLDRLLTAGGLVVDDAHTQRDPPP